MKKAKLILRILAGLFAAVALFCVGAMAINGPIAHTPDISKAYTYEASTADALPEDAPDEIEEDGKVYVRVEDESAAPEVTVLEQDDRRTETVSLTGLTSQQAPETKTFPIGGKEYTLYLESADYTPVEKEYHAQSDVPYTQRTRPNAPEKADVSYVNAAGETVTVEGTLVSVEEVGEKNVQNSYRSTIRLPAGASAFIVNGKVVTYNPSSPLWDGYQADVLAGLGLDGSKYRVVGGKWAGEPYSEGTDFLRDIVWYVESTSRSWIAHYEASGTSMTYDATAVYSGNVHEIGMDATLANDTTYTLSTDITYRLSEIVSGNPIVKMMHNNELLFPAIAGISFILALVALFTSIFVVRIPHEQLEHDEDEDAPNPEDAEDAEFTKADDDDDNFDTFIGK